MGATGGDGRSAAPDAPVAVRALAAAPSTPQVAAAAVRVRGAGGGVSGSETLAVTVPGEIFQRGALSTVGGRLGRSRVLDPGGAADGRPVRVAGVVATCSVVLVIKGA